MANFVPNKEINALIDARYAFQWKRFGAYAAHFELTDQEPWARLMRLFNEGNNITALMDDVVPAELHSSRYPEMRREVGNA
jgi:hypothetical protein